MNIEKVIFLAIFSQSHQDGDAFLLRNSLGRVIYSVRVREHSDVQKPKWEVQHKNSTIPAYLSKKCLSKGRRYFFIYSCVSLAFLIVHCNNNDRTDGDFPIDLAYLTNLCLRLALNASQKAAIAVAINRLHLLLLPHRWIHRSTWYRYGLIGFAWTWAVGQEMIPVLVFLLSNAELHNGLFYYQVFSSAVNSIFLIISYIITIVVSPKFCKRAMKGAKSIRVYCSNMEQTQRLLAKRVNALAFFTVVSHILLANRI